MSLHACCSMLLWVQAVLVLLERLIGFASSRGISAVHDGLLGLLFLTHLLQRAALNAVCNQQAIINSKTSAADENRMWEAANDCSMQYAICKWASKRLAHMLVCRAHLA